LFFGQEVARPYAWEPDDTGGTGGTEDTDGTATAADATDHVDDELMSLPMAGVRFAAADPDAI